MGFCIETFKSRSGDRRSHILGSVKQSTNFMLETLTIIVAATIGTNIVLRAHFRESITEAACAKFTSP